MKRKTKFVLLLAAVLGSGLSAAAQTKINLSNQAKGPAVINQEADGNVAIKSSRATDTACTGYFIRFFATNGSTPLYGVDCEGAITVSSSGPALSSVEAAAPSGVALSDILYADSTAHRWKMINNNGTAVQLVASGVDINISDQVTATHLASPLPLAQGGTNATSFAAGSRCIHTNAGNTALEATAADCGTGGGGTRAVIFLLGADNGAVLADADDQATIWRNTLGQGVTITEVWCECDGGTPRIQLQRDDGSPANILTDNSGAGMDCSTSGATGTLDGTEEHIASTNKIDFVMVAAGGTAKRITLAITYTLD